LIRIRQPSISAPVLVNRDKGWHSVNRGKTAKARKVIGPQTLMTSRQSSKING
jgi:hypothetical protein